MGLIMRVLFMSMVLINVGGQLVENFYSSTCPHVEATVKQAVSIKFIKTNTTLPATLRLFFHDCFIEAGGPSFTVELGRRDGLISNKYRVQDNIPEPDFNLTQLTTLFSRKNLSQFDMTALSGAHSIGFSHCRHFTNRLYPSVDPSLNQSYAEQLKETCKNTIIDPEPVVILDPETPDTLDNVYYQNLVAGKGLFTSDEVLYTHPESQPTVKDFAKSPGYFNEAFTAAMKKLGRVGVKTGNLGEIRRDCTAFNDPETS